MKLRFIALALAIVAHLDAATLPAAPATIAVKPSEISGQVTLAWDAVPGATGYAIRRSPGLNGPFATLSASQSTTTFTDAPGAPGVFAYYVVTTLSAEGESPAIKGVWAAPAVILDNVSPGGSASGVATAGTWTTSGIAGSYGVASVFAPAVSGPTPTASYTFTPVLPARGRYDVYLRWTAGTTRAFAAPFDFQTHDATRTLTFNQTINGSEWNLATSLVCEPGTSTSITLRNNGTNNNVVADAIQFVPRHAPLAPAAERPQDYTVPVLFDSFDGTAINPAVWKQFQDRPHFSVVDGKLRLRLVWSGPNPLADSTAAEIGNDANWSEGGITSQQSQKFGYHESRFRIPPASAKGVDTAYWHNPVDEVLNGYEIDAPEFFNTDATGTLNNFGFGVWDHFLPTREIPGLRAGRTWDYTARSSTLAPSADGSGFITVGLEWRTDNTQVVYVNGQKLYEAPASGMNDVESILPSNIILSTKILNWMGPTAGLDGAEALWDYALYYQKPGWLGTASSAWADPANWGPDGLPGPGRAAVFNVSPPAPSITIATDQNLSSLSLDGAALPPLTFTGPGALRLGASPDPSLTHGGILVNTTVSSNQTFSVPLVGVQSLQFANLSRTPGVTLRLDGLISGDGVAPRDIDFASSTAANVNLGPIMLGQPLGPGLRHVNRAGDCDFTLPAGSQHSGELRIARGTVILPDATALGLDPAAAIVFKPNSKHSEPYRPRLRYVGPAATLNRPIQISGWQADAVIESNGSGPLTLNGPVLLQPSSPDPLKTLTRDLRLALNALTGSGENILAAPLSDLGLLVSYTNSDSTLNTGPATLSLTKGGAGTWVLTGDNNLAEPVTITSGRLVIGRGNSGSLKLRTSPRTAAVPAVTVGSTAELVFGRDDDVSFSTRISGLGGIRKRGLGNLTLTGSHIFAGATTVQSGTLRLDGALTGNGTINVSSGATLVGSGSSTGSANIDGTLVVSPLAFGGSLALRASSIIHAGFTANSAPAAGPVVSSGVVITSGARVNVSLNAVGSSADLRHVYWRTARVFPLVAAGSRSGNLALGTITADSAGNAVSTFGAFSLQHTATGVDLLWTPVPGYPSYDYVSLDLVSPSSPVVSLPDAAHALRLTALVGGGTLDTLAWTLVSGPGGATFAAATSPDTTVTFSTPGTYVLRLSAINVLGSVTRDFTVNVAPPTALMLREAGAPSSLHPATFIRGDSVAWNSGSRDQVLVGRNNAALRSLLAFTLPALPPGATISAADLDLWAAANGAGNTVGPLDLHRLLVPFAEGTGDGAASTNGSGTGADWINRASATAWTSAGASSSSDLDATPLQTLPAINPTATDVIGTRLPFTSTPALVAAIIAARDAGEPLRLLLKATTDTSGGNAFVRLASDDHANPALRPRLTLTLQYAYAPTIDPGPVPVAIAGQPAMLAGSVTNADSSLWTLANGPSVPIFSNATTAASSAIFPSPGVHVLRLSATNAHGESSRLLAVSALPQRAAWRQTYFSITANSGPAADLADPDGDGVVNLLEYAFSTDPTSAASVPVLLPSTSTPNGSLSISFLRARAELTYVVEASSDLVVWQDIATNPGAVSPTVSVTVIDSVSVSASSPRFLRLRVVTP